MRTSVSFLKSKTFKSSLFVMVVAGFFFLFHGSLVVFGVKHLLNAAFPFKENRQLKYSSVEYKKGSVFFTDLSFLDHENKVYIPELNLEVRLKLKNLFALSKCSKALSHLKKEKSISWKDSFLALLPIKEAFLGLEIPQGALDIGQKRFFFQFNHGLKDSVGMLSIGETNCFEEAFFIGKLSLKEGQILTKLDVHPVEADSFFRLLSFAFPELKEEWKEVEGQTAFQCMALVSKEGRLTQFALEGGLEDFGIVHTASQVHMKAKSLRGKIGYPESKSSLPFYKQLSLSFYLDKGELSLADQFHFSKLKGTLLQEEDQELKLSFTGALESKELPLKLNLEGKTSEHKEDKGSLLDFTFSVCDPSGVECVAAISLSNPKPHLNILELEATHLLKEQVALLQVPLSRGFPQLKAWHLEEGTIGGKLLFIFENGVFSSSVVENFVGKGIQLKKNKELEALSFDTIKIHGRLDRSQKGDLSPIGQFNVDLALPSSPLFGWVDKALKSAYATEGPDPTALVSAHLQFKEKEVETIASLAFLDPQLKGVSMQFGFKSTSCFPKDLSEIKEGWVRSERLTPEFYFPLVSMQCPDLEIYGEMDLFGTLNGKDLELGICATDLLVKHPFLNFKVKQMGEKDKTEGRAKLQFDLVSHQLEATLPLREAFFYDRRSGVVLENALCDAFFSVAYGKSTLKGSLKEAKLRLEGVSLATDVKGDFFLKGKEEEMLFSNVTALLPFSSPLMHVQIPSFCLNKETATCSLSLLNGKKQYAHFEGMLTHGHWEGNLHLDFPQTLSGTCFINMELDPLTALFHLQAKSEQLVVLNESVKGIKAEIVGQEKGYLLNSLQWDDKETRASFTKAAEGWRLSFLDFFSSKAQLHLSGNACLDLSAAEGLCLRSTLEGEMRILNETLPLQIKTLHPLMLGFSPQLGLVLSDVECSLGKGSFQIDYLEKMFGSKKMHINKCHFQLTKALVDRLVKASYLPQFVGNMQCAKNLSGVAHMSVSSGGETVITGSVQESSLAFELNMSPLEKGSYPYKLFLKDPSQKEGIVIEAERKPESEIVLNALKGSLGPVRIDLKKNNKGALKGACSFDFSHFHELFDLPLNRYLGLWQVGKGYELEGEFTLGSSLVDTRFKGRLTAERFECAGCNFRSLEAKIDFTPGKLLVENLEISDEVGKLWAAEGVLNCSKEGSSWMFYFPLVELRAFQPTFLHRSAGEKKKGAPSLVIKSACLKEVKGKVDDLSSVQASGNFQFQAKPKSAANLSLKNLSKEALERLGLDEALFFPTVGEVEYKVQEGKCFFRELKGVYSENKRSEFFFNPTIGGGYLDFKGNLFLDVKVRQHVASSVTAPLSLSVRGHFDEIELSVK